MDVVSVIQDFTGKTIVADTGYTELWYQYYQGNVTGFHNYLEYNGIKDIDCTRKTLNMPKKICEDWANLLLNEKTDVVVGNDEQQQQLDNLLNSVNFWVKGNEGIEKSFALGKGALVQSVDEAGNPHLQFVNGLKIYPITIEHGKITECAFVNSGSRETIIQIHTKGENGNYDINTLIYEKQQNTMADDIGSLVQHLTLNTGSNLPWYQIIKPNIANNIDINSPLGISIYANALDNLQGVDLAYDGFCEEMRLGRARIFVNKDLVRYDENGETPTFDNNEVGFYYGGSTDNDKVKPFEFYSPTLRVENYFNGINNALNLLSAKVGFGENHYRFDQGGISTATQIISENSEMFRTLKKHEILLNDVIIEACKVLMYIHNTFKEDVFKFDLSANIEVKFDDSIIEDKETMKITDRQDVSMGVMSKIEYRMKWFNEDEETARQKIAGIDEEQKANSLNFFSEE